MTNQLLHIYRNTPLGREVLIQSAYFCRHARFDLVVNRPTHHQFLMYFGKGIATIDLDRAFLRDPESAEAHIAQILGRRNTPYQKLQAKEFTAKVLPDLPVDFAVMTCPRSIGNLSTRIGLGFIGPRVRNIIIQAQFPVFLPTLAAKTWSTLACFFGGSPNGVRAFRCALDLQRRTGDPLRLLTQDDGRGRAHFEAVLRKADLLAPIEEGSVEWVFWTRKTFKENLFDVHSDDLVVIGAYGQHLARELVFGVKAELVQTVVPNPILVVGPQYRPAPAPVAR